MTAKRYEFMTINQLAHAVCDAANGTEFTFTFDTKESLAQNGEPTGWYGAKIIDIFGEEKGTLCFGYWGGGCTQCADLAVISDDEWNYDSNVEAIERQLREWFTYGYDWYKGIDTVCVAVTDENEYEIRYWTGQD